MIRPKIAPKIKTITSYLVEHYSNKNYVDLISIASSEDINIHVDNYEDAFDGMLVADEDRFHIHLNSGKGNTEKSGRGRFSLAHELGHFFIDDHLDDILRGKLLHPSFQKGKQNIQYEIEADQFAADLLMPKEKFRNACAKRQFNWDLIEFLSKEFGTSIFASLIRSMSILRHEVFYIISNSDNIITSFDRNNDFPLMKHRFRRGQLLPSHALAYAKTDFFSPIIDGGAGDWFETWGGKSERELYQQCYYAAAYDCYITLLWYK